MQRSGSEAARRDRILRSPAFRGGRFHNPVGTRVMLDRPAGTMARFLFDRRDREPDVPLPVVRPDPATLGAAPADGVRITWLGHSSVLIDVEGARVLCDPVFSERASPTPLAGPRRFHPPPLALADLPAPDVVLLSHDHYDHLDERTIRALAGRGARFVTALGVGGHLERWGVPPDRVVELDWHESADVIPGRLALAATPSRHFSGRGPFDRNRTLWASWVIHGATRRVFFGGDGGLWDGFRDIGEAHGPFDAVLLEIGAFDPAWGQIHLGPANAVEARRRLGSGLLVPIHWGTFNLGLHAWFAPPEELLVAARGTGLDVAFPRLGQTFSPSGPIPTDPWWREVLRERMRGG